MLELGRVPSPRDSLSTTGLARPSHPGHLLELLEVSTDVLESGVDLPVELRELAADLVRIGAVWYLQFARLKGTNLTTAVSANDDVANSMPLQMVYSEICIFYVTQLITNS